MGFNPGNHQTTGSPRKGESSHGLVLTRRLLKMKTVLLW
jgi:hypothetical protein